MRGREASSLPLRLHSIFKVRLSRRPESCVRSPFTPAYSRSSCLNTLRPLAYPVSEACHIVKTDDTLRNILLCSPLAPTGPAGHSPAASTTFGHSLTQ